MGLVLYLGEEQLVPLFDFNSFAGGEHVCFPADGAGLSSSVRCGLLRNSSLDGNTGMDNGAAHVKHNDFVLRDARAISCTDREGNTRLRVSHRVLGKVHFKLVTNALHGSPLEDAGISSRAGPSKCVDARKETDPGPVIELRLH